MNIRQAAKVIGVSPRTLQSWVEKKIVPFTVIGENGRGLKVSFNRYNLEDILKFVKERNEAKRKYHL